VTSTATAPANATERGIRTETSRATRVRRRAVWALAVTVGIGALVTMALVTTAPDQVLDPDDSGPTGGKAVVQVLRAHGVDVQVVRSVDALADADPGTGTTVVMANSAYVGHDSAQLMGDVSAGADRLVLLSPSATQLAALDLPLTSGELGAMVTVTARCTSTVTRADDTAALVDVRLIPLKRGSGTTATLCFALPDPNGDTQRESGSGSDAFGFGAAMATVPAAADHPEVVALGVSRGFTNRWVDDESHAGLAIRALGHSPRLLWYQPGIGDLANFNGAPTDSAWPVWLAPGAAVVATAILVLAFVRGRRMGALVTEPLPVVVRAVETTESRGRIYRRARDRGRAAAILRLGSTERLARRLALPPQAAEAVQAAAAAASGMPPTQVAALLAGPPPNTDIELHTLATALTDLEERVRRS
jgi:hypothetical protein